MDKMRMESVDSTKQNIEKIGELFPNCITETVDEDGNLKKAINFDLLHQMLSDEVLGVKRLMSLLGLERKLQLLRLTDPSVRLYAHARKKVLIGTLRKTFM